MAATVVLIVILSGRVVLLDAYDWQTCAEMRGLLDTKSYCVPGTSETRIVEAWKPS